jgi:hypothetical protein
MKINETTKKFARTMSEAFPDERANTITCYKKRPLWRELLRIAFILALIFGTLTVGLILMMPA